MDADCLFLFLLLVLGDFFVCCTFWTSIFSEVFYYIDDLIRVVSGIC